MDWAAIFFNDRPLKIEGAAPNHVSITIFHLLRNREKKFDKWQYFKIYPIKVCFGLKL